ncbi:MAG: phosphoglycerate kinase [Acidimicrobiia bacterium]|nr:MAG: phosphoglycerate kinase [Acidimicrobiia bacterium]
MAEEPLRTIDSLELSESTVLVRSDLNVPLVDGVVADTFRITASLGTIEELLGKAKRVVVASHLGRPQGYDPSLSMGPVAETLAHLGGFDTMMAPGVTGSHVEAAVRAAPAGTVVVLENTRFEPGETRNDPALADGFADLADVFVDDAFGTAHRVHASNVGVAQRLPSAAGRLLQSEIAAFDRLLVDTERPYVVVMGGAKISDKLAAIENLLPKVDLMLIGGGMCFTLLQASGYAVGDSLVEESMIDTVEALLASENGDKIVLPTDIVAADTFASNARHETVPVAEIRPKTIGLDIGPESIEQFSNAIHEAESVFWNGPMGVFEWEAFRAGTAGVADSIASCDGYTVVGGGDSVAAIRMLNREQDISHVSSGGGAGLAMLEGAELPGVEILKRRPNAED